MVMACPVVFVVMLVSFVIRLIIRPVWIADIVIAHWIHEYMYILCFLFPPFSLSPYKHQIPRFSYFHYNCQGWVCWNERKYLIQRNVFEPAWYILVIIGKTTSEVWTTSISRIRMWTGIIRKFQEGKITSHGCDAESICVCFASFVCVFFKFVRLFVFVYCCCFVLAFFLDSLQYI